MKGWKRNLVECYDVENNQDDHRKNNCAEDRVENLENCRNVFIFKRARVNLYLVEHEESEVGMNLLQLMSKR